MPARGGRRAGAPVALGRLGAGRDVGRDVPLRRRAQHPLLPLGPVSCAGFTCLASGRCHEYSGQPVKERAISPSRPARRRGRERGRLQAPPPVGAVAAAAAAAARRVGRGRGRGARRRQRRLGEGRRAAAQLPQPRGHPRPRRGHARPAAGARRAARFVFFFFTRPSSRCGVWGTVTSSVHAAAACCALFFCLPRLSSGCWGGGARPLPSRDVTAGSRCNNE